MCLLAGCAEDRYFGDWGRSPSAQSGDAVTSASSRPSTFSEAGPAGTNRPVAEPANLLDSAPESISAQDRRAVRLVVYLDVLRVEVPIGSISESVKIWSHLDEQAIGAQRAVTLRRNGLRVGVGRGEAWAPIKAILDGMSDRLVYRDTALLNTGSFYLEISGEPDDQTVFFFRDDGTLAGESIPASRNVFQVGYELVADDPSKVTLKVIPEICQHQRRMEWARQGDRYTRVPVYQGRVLRELAIEATLAGGSFLAIGPGDEVKLNPVIGRTLLTRKVESKQYESVYFLTPNVRRSGLVTVE
jgi:hypothetical protein